MNKYVFDCKLWATAQVCAKNEREARELLQTAINDAAAMFEVNTGDVSIREAYMEGEGDLIETREA